MRVRLANGCATDKVPVELMTTQNEKITARSRHRPTESRTRGTAYVGNILTFLIRDA